MRPLPSCDRRSLKSAMLLLLPPHCPPPKPPPLLADACPPNPSEAAGFRDAALLSVMRLPSNEGGPLPKYVPPALADAAALPACRPKGAGGPPSRLEPCFRNIRRAVGYG